MKISILPPSQYNRERAVLISLNSCVYLQPWLNLLQGPQSWSREFLMLNNKRPISLKIANISPMVHCCSGIAWICSNCEIEENDWEDGCSSPMYGYHMVHQAKESAKTLSASRTELSSPVSVCNQKRLQALKQAAMESK